MMSPCERCGESAELETCSGCGSMLCAPCMYWEHRPLCRSLGDRGCSVDAGAPRMTDLDQALYAAFKRGIGWRLSNPESTSFHAAAIAYVRECREPAPVLRKHYYEPPAIELTARLAPGGDEPDPRLPGQLRMDVSLYLPPGPCVGCGHLVCYGPPHDRCTCDCYAVGVAAALERFAGWVGPPPRKRRLLKSLRGRVAVLAFTRRWPGRRKPRRPRTW
jgi:hypothetical protein